MKKIIIFSVIGIALITVLMWFGKMNKKSTTVFEVEKPFITSIDKKTVATGKITPLEEIEIKPQITGIIDKILFEEGDVVKKGDLIATVRVVPNEQSLISARGRVTNIKIQVNNAKIQYDRSRVLLDKGVIARQEFENTELNYNSAKQNLRNAQNDYQIIRKGSVSSSKSSNTNIRATASGTILQIPVEEGDQVIQSNNFNSGTTIALVADMKKMIFEGKVDEAEVGKIKLNTPLNISIGAIGDTKFPAILNFIAPKGIDENGTVQFTIKADLKTDKDIYIRAGYSANAEMILEKKDSVLAIREALLRFNQHTDKPYVEIKIGDNKFKKKKVKLGLSDGENVEILEGITKDDEIKVWNKLEKKEKKNSDK